MKPTDKVPTDPQTFDANGNQQFKRLQLDPELADGYHWIIQDGPSPALDESIRIWMENAQPGDSFTIKLKAMSDREVAQLPEI